MHRQSKSKSAKLPKKQTKQQKKTTKKLQTKTKRTFTTKPVQQQQATIFGGYGTIGPFVAQYLGPTGMRLVAAYRDDGHKVRKLKVVGEVGQVAPKFFEWTDPESIRNTLQGTDLVINMIGSQIPTLHFNEYDANLRTAIRVAKTAKEMGAKRFIHVSAAGADANSESPFLRAKFESEEAVKAYFPNATIVRPCFTYDINNTYIHSLARQCFEDDAKVTFAGTLIQPTYARDVGAAIAQIALHPEIDGQLWTLGGEKVMRRSEVFDTFKNMIAHHHADVGDHHKAHFLGPRDSMDIHATEQLQFWAPHRRLTPKGSIEYFGTDIYVDKFGATKGFAELGIQPANLELTFMRMAKSYLNNLSPSVQNKNLFKWKTGAIDEQLTNRITYSHNWDRQLIRETAPSEEH